MSKYYFFHPLSRQYYFPENFEKYSVFKNFFYPYTVLGSLVWFLWRHLKVIRTIFKEDLPNELIPYERLSKFVPSGSIMAFNKGTPGKEQKLTVLGIDMTSGEEFFLKYAENAVARDNVNNEANILSQLSSAISAPTFKLHVREVDFSIIITTVLKGNRVNDQVSSEQLMCVLFEIACQKIVTDKNYLTKLDCCFAHGDFCPWNIMLFNDKIQVYDWEMAGYYPVGYDLFTYIFQTSFLLTPNTTIRQICEKNNSLIEAYFKHFKVCQWRSYLLEFAEMKILLEKQKESGKLIVYYQRLKEYAKEV